MTDFIEVYDDVLSASFCRDFIQRFDASPHTAAGRTGGGVDTAKKISSDLYLNERPEFRQELATILKATTLKAAEYMHKHHFALIAPIALKVADPASGEPVNLTHENYPTLGASKALDLMRALYRLGPVQAQKYEAGKGNYNYWHCEVYPEAPHNEALHRSLLFMFYLNDVAEGGQTEFYYQNRAIRPKAGRMVIAPAYFTHTHRGCTPVSNDKYILTSWILMNRAEQLFGG